MERINIEILGVKGLMINHSKLADIISNYPNFKSLFPFKQPLDIIIKIKIHHILLVWESFVESAFFELIIFNFLLQGFVVGALILQWWARSLNHSGFLISLVTLINCETLKKISEMACVRPAWSPHGQTLKTVMKKGNAWASSPDLLLETVWHIN